MNKELNKRPGPKRAGRAIKTPGDIYSLLEISYKHRFYFRKLRMNNNRKVKEIKTSEANQVFIY
jgi:hypothetical protein